MYSPPVSTPVPGFDPEWVFVGTGYRWLANPVGYAAGKGFTGFPWAYAGRPDATFAGERADWIRTWLADYQTALARVAAEGVTRWWPSYTVQVELRPLYLVSPLCTDPGNRVAQVPGWRIIVPGDGVTPIGPVSTARPDGGWAFTEQQILQFRCDGMTGLIGWLDFFRSRPIPSTTPPVDVSRETHGPQFDGAWDNSFQRSPLVVGFNPWVRAP